MCSVSLLVTPHHWADLAMGPALQFALAILALGSSPNRVVTSGVSLPIAGLLCHRLGEGA